MKIPKQLARLLAAALIACATVTSPSAATASDAVAQALEQMNRRLDQLESQNRALTARVDELTRQNETLLAAAPVATAAPSAPAAVAANAPAAPDEWASRIKFGGDFRFRHENTEVSTLANSRTLENIRARLAASIRINDKVKGEIGMSTGARNPRSGNALMGEASARKDLHLDLGYMSWQALDELSLTAGKMREPYVRPGRSMFFDNEIRPEGIAANYRHDAGVFASAFNFWLEERPQDSDSMLRGGQLGWDGKFGDVKLKTGVGYWDYHNVQGRFPGFGNSVLSDLGNSIAGTGATARYVYDYDIGQVFAEVTLPIAGIPLNVFADYGHNFEAGNGLDTAYSVGFLVGKASRPGQWEAGVLKQRVEKDALFAHWTDSEFAGGVTDNDGYAWRLAWMAMKNVIINATYYDTQFNVDVGNEGDFDRWQIDFNFTF